MGCGIREDYIRRWRPGKAVFKMVSSPHPNNSPSFPANNIFFLHMFVHICVHNPIYIYTYIVVLFAWGGFFHFRYPRLGTGASSVCGLKFRDPGECKCFEPVANYKPARVGSFLRTGLEISRPSTEPRNPSTSCPEHPLSPLPP